MNFVNLEAMTATNKVAEALKMRGFFVEEAGGTINFMKSSSKKDMEQAVGMLDHLGLPFIVHRDYSVEILINKLPNIVFKKIFKFGGEAFQINFSPKHENWRYFTSKRFGLRVEALDLEYNMARFVKIANLAGIATFAGCNGHLKHSPRFQFSGVFQGAWFKAVQQKYMADLELNYNWEVIYQGFTQTELRAVNEAKWDQSLIHQDTLKMSEVLEKHGPQIRTIKKSVFLKYQQEPKSYVKNRQFQDLETWMYETSFQNKC